MQTGCMTSFLLFLMLKLLNKGVFKEKGKQNLILLLFDHELDNFLLVSTKILGFIMKIVSNCIS